MDDLKTFNENEQAIREVTESALKRYANGDQLYLLDEEVERTGMSLEFMKSFVETVFKKMQYQFLMGPEEPKGVWEGPSLT